MIYFIWSLPLLIVALLIGSGRTNSVGAGLCGAAAAVIVALTAAPTIVTPPGVLLTAAKGIWLAVLVGAVILGGLFFREIVSRGDDRAVDSEATPDCLKRRRAFAACFLIGPFAEAATGFGVGQVTTVAILMRTGISPLHVVLLGLFSQVLVSWGAMANGTIVGAEFAGITPRNLGVHSATLTLPLLLAWLVLFWRIASSAGLESNAGHRVREFAWTIAAIALLILANSQLGPEIAGMAALGPLIVLRTWRDERPDRTQWRSMLSVGLPYVVLILGLAATRAIPTLNIWLSEAAVVQPFADTAVWFPLLHPSSWLIAVGLVAACALRRARAIPEAAITAWSRGRRSVLTIGIYLVVARILADSGIAGALAGGLGEMLGPYAVIATPWLAGAFGFLTGSSNASNALLMASQTSLAYSQVSLVWTAAIQNVAAAALTMLSPARVSMGCALVGLKDLERTVYRLAWPLGLTPLVLLSMFAALLVITGHLHAPQFRSICLRSFQSEHAGDHQVAAHNCSLRDPKPPTWPAS